MTIERWAEPVFTEEEKIKLRWNALYSPTDREYWNVLWLMASGVSVQLTAQFSDKLQSFYRQFKEEHGGYVPVTLQPRFILPPHPPTRCVIQRRDLPTYEAMGKWIAQRKFNGTHVVIWVCQNEVAIWDRRGIKLTLYKLTSSMKKCLLSLNRDPAKELVLAGELLHTKAKSKITNEQAATHTIVLFDVLYYGEHLTQITQLERLKVLSKLCGEPTEMEAGSFPGATKRALVVTREEPSNLWLAEVFHDDFLYRFDECVEVAKGKDRYPEIEGLVLRISDSHLKVSANADVEWMLKCRKTKEKIYPF